MIVDSSALVAMLLKEPEGQPIVIAIADSGDCRISSGNYLETSIIAIG